MVKQEQLKDDCTEKFLICIKICLKIKSNMRLLFIFSFHQKNSKKVLDY